MIKDGLKSVGTVHSFLMIGQSNMAGRGDIGDVEPIKNPNCYMLRMGRWQRMREPINTDRPIFSGKYPSGVSLGASFADALERETGDAIGLIPCADGGTSIDQWAKGEILYDHAVMMTQLAMRTSTLSGILWHQGESDYHSEESIATYNERLITTLTALRRDLNAEHLPLIMGELSTEVITPTNIDQRPARMNAILREAAKEMPNCALVSVEGLPLRSDNLHFSAAGYRTMGLRYFEAYLGLMKG